MKLSNSHKSHSQNDIRSKSEGVAMNVSHNRNNSPIAEQQADHGEEEACTDKSMPGRAEEPDTRGDEKRRE